MKRILITGGAGFIGSHTAAALAAKGYKIRILDNLQHEGGRTWPSAVSRKGYELIFGDVTRKNDWQKALKGVDAVYHFAVHKAMDLGFSKYFQTNTVGTALLYEVLAEKRYPVKKVILASSQAVYGDGFYECLHNGKIFHAELRPWEQLLRGEWDIKGPEEKPAEPIPYREDQKVAPTNPYALSKYAAESLAMRLGRTYEIPTTILRYSIVQGPGQSARNPFSDPLRIFVQQALSDKPITVFEDGNQTRDFVNIEDVVAANLMPLSESQTSYEIFNVGSGRAYRVLDLAELVKDITKSKSEIVTGSFRRTDIRHAVSDISKLKALSWKPKHEPEHTVRTYLQWVSEQSPAINKKASRRG